ncbi:unnamed protein product [Rotaria socialis]|uniref:EF-hand domain-containing protein n=1 Tax=Rotaria socialis TaxID=392032 RepID=A0A818GC39_9BILA|nr:unnamed protein product [Rotaria socialis]
MKLPIGVCYLQLIAIAYGVSVLMGAPLFSDMIRTLGFSIYIVLIGFTPVIISLKGDLNEIYNFLFRNEFYLLISTSRKFFYMRNLVWGTMLGAWLGAIPIPLDWDYFSFKYFTLFFYPAAHLTPSQERELHEAFYADHSGRISKSELKHVITALNIKVNDHELEKLLFQMDTDHSGEVDFDEFKTIMGTFYFKKYSKQELHAASKKFDEDGCEYITANELNHLLNHWLQIVMENFHLRNSVKYLIEEL